MFDASVAAHVAVDWNVVGSIYKCCCGLLVLHECDVNGAVERIPAIQAVSAQVPKVANNRHRGSGCRLEFVRIVGYFRRVERLNPEIDFWGLETDVFQIEIQDKFRQFLQLDRYLGVIEG
jgi:hypothetical protein